MRAVVRYTYGDESVLSLADLPDPVPGPGEVLVRVRAAGVDRGAWHVMTGLPALARLAFGLRRPRNPRLGMDAAGTVAAVGSDVTRFRVGDEVLGVVGGSFADLATTAERYLVPKPASVSWEQAAAAPTSTITAFDALRSRVTPGTRVLVLGAGGGVGHLAVQVASVLGGAVTAATSDPGFAASLGAETVIDYRTEPLIGTYDVILDIGGRRPVRELRALLSPTGTLVFVGGEGGGSFLGGMQRQLVVAPGSRQKFVTFVARTTPAALQEVAEHLAAGTVVPWSTAPTRSPRRQTRCGTSPVDRCAASSCCSRPATTRTQDIRALSARMAATRARASGSPAFSAGDRMPARGPLGATPRRARGRRPPCALRG